MSETLSTDKGTVAIESVIGRTVDEILEQYAEVEPFLLDLGAEALSLIDEIEIS